MLQLYDLWRRLTTLDGLPEDLVPQLAWTANLVPATIHGTKPDRATFYDGGDWNELPATPLEGSMRAFVKYQPDHPMAPFARYRIQCVIAPLVIALRDQTVTTRRLLVDPDMPNGTPATTTMFSPGLARPLSFA